jgi:hypothetical protein
MSRRCLLTERGVGVHNWASVRFLHAAFAWFVLAAVFCGAAPAHAGHCDGPTLIAVDDVDTGIADEPVVLPTIEAPASPNAIEVALEIEQLSQSVTEADVLSSAPKTSPPSA